MRQYGKLLFGKAVNDASNKFSGLKDTSVGVYGIFDTKGTGKWSYYLISFNSSGKLTPDWHTFYSDLNVESVIKHSDKVQSMEEGVKICEEFVEKWNSGSNDVLSKRRDDKINTILD